MSKLMRAFAFFIGLLPGACHYSVTAPRLWAHNSSAAFDVWVFGWIFGLLFLVFCWYHAFTGKN